MTPLHDWVGGLDDLRAGLIRTIGDPEARLGEDSLRLLRVPRFAAQLGFKVEAATLAAVRARAAEIRRVSAERIRDELEAVRAPSCGGRPRVVAADGLAGRGVA
ncbi:MAG: hypothetical protein M5U12_35485 [Verrucomicrobia bacterium]|nr:hypothetical protein [Verrucomicrobiota bacterium]